MPHVVKNTRAALDEKGKIFIKNVGVNGIVIKDTIKEDKKYFLALLNSNLASFFISKTSIFLSGGFYATNKQFAGEIPIKEINFSNLNEKQSYNKLINNVSAIMELKQKLISLKLNQAFWKCERGTRCAVWWSRMWGTY